MKKAYANENITAAAKTKLRGNRGETIAEVLIAALVAAFAAIVLVSMVTASKNMLTKSEASYAAEIDEKNRMEELLACLLTDEEIPETLYAGAEDAAVTEADVTIEDPEENGAVEIRPGAEEKVLVYSGSEFRVFRAADAGN